MIHLASSETGSETDLSLASAVHLPSYCEIDFGPHLVGEGWDACERSDTTRYRWMGCRKCATIVLAVDRRVELEVVVKVFMVIDPACWSSFRFAVDGQSLAAEVDSDHRTCRMVLPARSEPFAATKLEICNGTSRIPMPDTRLLSVAVSRVSVRSRQDVLPEPLRLDFDAKISAYIRQLGDLAPVQRRPRSV